MKEFLHTRRLFLQRGVSLLAATQTIPLFLDNTVMALDATGDGLRQNQESGKDGKILVVIQLSGGNDGLNTVIPYADDAYQRARPGLGKKPDDVLKVNDYLGFNPKLAPLKNLFDNGQMSIVQGVGYPNPNRSHFRSMDIWHTAEPESERNTNGWIGRYFDSQCAGNEIRNVAAGVTQKPTTQPTDSAASLGLAIGDVSPLAMRSERISTLNFERADAFRYKGKDAANFVELNGLDADPQPAAAATPAPRGRAVAKPPTASEQLNFLSRTALDAQASSDRILKATAAHKPAGVEYPRGTFGDGLRTVAAMIRAEMPTRVYYVSLGGFDTHADQGWRHDNLMTQLANGVAAFMADLQAQKNDDRVLLMTFSEFGRRVAQNASNGTDHGAAAPLFLFGSRLKQGVVGKHPSLTDLDSGDLKFGVDFRNVYASILQNWLDTPSKPILGKQFSTFDLVRG